MDNKFRNKNGITLIALVVTIIILLILAGIVLATLSGNSGILNQVAKAKEETEKAEELEKVQLAVTSVMTKGYGTLKDEYINSSFQEELSTNENISGIGPWYYKGKNIRYKISIDGEITILKGNANEITSQDYGKYVNYHTPISTDEENFPLYPSYVKWQILYSDEENVYLIAESTPGKKSFMAIFDNYNNPNGNISDLLKDSNRYSAAKRWLYGFIDKKTNDWYLIPNSTAHSIRSALYLLDSENVWNINYKNEYADYAIGAPTMELMCASYDKIENTNYKEDAYATKYEDKDKVWAGYPCNMNLNLEDKSYLGNKNFSYWLVNPSDYEFNHNLIVDSSSNKIATGYIAHEFYFRPVIRLKSNINLVWNNSSNAYDITQ